MSLIFQFSVRFVGISTHEALYETNVDMFESRNPFDFRSWRKKRIHIENSFPHYAVDLVPCKDGETLLMGTAEGNVFILDLNTQKTHWTLEDAQSESVSVFDEDPVEDLTAFCSPSRGFLVISEKVTGWDLVTLNSIGELTLNKGSKVEIPEAESIQIFEDLKPPRAVILGEKRIYLATFETGEKKGFDLVKSIASPAKKYPLLILKLSHHRFAILRGKKNDVMVYDLNLNLISQFTNATGATLVEATEIPGNRLLVSLGSKLEVREIASGKLLTEHRFPFLLKRVTGLTEELFAFGNDEGFFVSSLNSPQALISFPSEEGYGPVKIFPLPRLESEKRVMLGLLREVGMPIPGVLEEVILNFI